MKERPILFSTEMVQAILDGRKTMTRRAVKPQPSLKHRFKYICKEKTKGWGALFEWLTDGMTFHEHFKSPYGTVGDVLWVRETWCYGFDYDSEGNKILDKSDIYYKALESEPMENKWRPSIFMPRSASRISLRITNIRVERLNEITDGEVAMEGVTWNEPFGTKAYHVGDSPAQRKFAKLWESINGKGSWGQNPWVWVIEFEVIK